MTTTLTLSPRGRVTARTNLVRNPVLGTAATDWGAGSWAGGAGTAGRVSSGGFWWYQMTFTTPPTGFGAAVLNFAVGNSPVTPGLTYTARIFGRVSWAGAQMAARIFWYNSAGAFLSNGPSGAVATPGAGLGRVYTAEGGVAPSGAAYARLDFYQVGGTLPPVNGTMEAIEGFVENAATFGGFFYGSTPAAGDRTYEWVGTPHASASVERISDPDTTTTAIFALGYGVTRPARTIVHEVPNAVSLPVTFKPAGPRSGTIEYLFATRDECRRSEIIHTRVGYVTITDADWPDSPMRYVPQGAITTTLDPETRTHWILSTGFTEIPA